VIYRILLDSVIYLPASPSDEGDGDTRDRPSGSDLRGAFSAGLGAGWRDLPMPGVHDRRLRFWFTEAGWRQYGQDVCAAAKADGHIVRVLRRKNPRRSQVAYRDRYQVALLPPPRDRA